MRRSTLVLVGILALVVAELWLIVLLGQQVGVGWMVAILVAEGVLGGLLLRHEGPKAWRSLADARSDPELLGPKLTDAGLVLVGGILIMLPGFLTDLLGALFLIPATRGIARKGVTALFGALTRKARERAGLLDAQLRPDTVVRGETVAPGEDPDDPMIIRGEIER